MKKLISILIIALIGTMAAYSQDLEINQDNAGESIKDYAKHRLFVYGSSGYSNNIYHRVNKSLVFDHYSYDLAFELKYAFFFAREWGVSLGAGFSRFNAKGTLNIEGMYPKYYDPGFDPSGNHYYDLHYKTNGLVEKQLIHALEVPLQFHFEHHIGKNGIFASLGARGYFPLTTQSKFSKGTMNISGYEAFTDTWYIDPPHFGECEISSLPTNVKMSPYSVDGIADLGGIFRISRKCDLYIGAYGSYGFMDILPKSADRKNFIIPEQNNNFAVKSLLATNFLSEYNNYIKNEKLTWKKADEKWNKWQVGIKIGLHLKLSGKKEKEKSKIIDSPPVIVIRDTVRVVNIYNMSPIVQTDDSNFTPEEKENIDKLTDLLSSGRILFNLDSDIPKIDNQNFITAASEVLKIEPSLRLIIEGYTCELGNEAHNRELAARRANAIRNLFIAQGIDSERIQTAGYTVNDPESKINIADEDLRSHRVVIFRIVKGSY